ncbi:MAG TPA: VCBS repeat-containing protein, partial [Planctomycetota bacterium]|nr:VCBS repeat-containing protein [Planctomycetota bacterium]
PPPAVFIDMDGDGDRDGLVPDPVAPIFYENQEGVLVPTAGVAPIPSLPPAGALGCRFCAWPVPVRAFAADLDGDALEEVIVDARDPLCFCRATFAWRRVGPFAFADAPPPFAATSDDRLLATRDADGDGLVDLMTRVEGAPESLAVRFNVGGGACIAAATCVAPGVACDLAAFADVDGDGLLDVVAAGVDASQSPCDVLFLQLPGRTFAAAVVTPRAVAATGLAAADFDGDGDDEALRAGPRGVEVFAATAGSLEATRTTVLRPGHFPSLAALDAFSDDGAADLDGDGRRDLLLVDGAGPIRFDARARLARDGAEAVVADAFEPSWWRPAATPWAADFDGDGDADVAGVAVVHDDFPLVQRRLAFAANDGLGGFTPEAWGPPLPDGRIPAVVDGDGDGVLDLVFFGAGGITVWRRAPGGWAAVTLPPAGAAGPVDEQPTVIDFDHDGDLDVVLAGGVLSEARVLLNGGGSWTAGPSAGLLLVGGGVAAGDADADGDVDLLQAAPAGFGGDSIYWRNDGGVFTATALAPAVHGPSALFADVDGDGDLDGVVSGVLYWNQGGAFVAGPAVATPLGVPPAAAAAADLDGDGSLDLVATRHWFRGYGALGFGPAEAFAPFLLPWDGDGRPAVVDFDRDGDQDVLLPSGEIAWNLPQLVRREAARLGRTGTLSLHGAPLGVAELFVALAPLAAPWPLPPWGTLFLDPAATFPAGACALDLDGAAELDLAVPNDPSLVGAALWWQAALPAEARLTNAVATVVAPY